MRDPGCHWFAAGSKFKTKLIVSGAAKLTQPRRGGPQDQGCRRDQARQRRPRALSLSRGAYTITMVGQKPDDNTLHLTVH